MGIELKTSYVLIRNSPIQENYIYTYIYAYIYSSPRLDQMVLEQGGHRTKKWQKNMTNREKKKKFTPSSELLASNSTATPLFIAKYSAKIK